MGYPTVPAKTSAPVDHRDRRNKRPTPTTPTAKKALTEPTSTTLTLSGADLDEYMSLRASAASNVAAYPAFAYKSATPNVPLELDQIVINPDSMANIHIIGGDKSRFSSYKEIKTPIAGVADAFAVGIGTIAFTIVDKKSQASTTFEILVHHLPSYKGLLYSTNIFTQEGGKFIQSKTGDTLIMPDGTNINVGRDKNNLPYFVGTIVKSLATLVQPAKAYKAVAPYPTIDSDTALAKHKQYGCIPYEVLAQVLQVKIVKPFPNCDACPWFKGKRQAIATVGENPREFPLGSLWGSDFKGPWSTKSIGGNLYAVLFVERHTKFRLVYFTPAKNGTVNILPAFIIDARRLHFPIGPGAATFTIHSDNGKGEYRSAAVIEALCTYNATLTACPPDTPQKNGVPERQWGIIIPTANALMSCVPGDMPPGLWSYAVSHAVYIANFLPTVTLHNKSSFTVLEEITGLRVPLAHVPLHKFGATAYLQLPRTQRQPGPAADSAVLAVYIGTSHVNLASQFWRPDTHRVSESMHANITDEYTNLFVENPSAGKQLRTSGHKPKAEKQRSEEQAQLVYFYSGIYGRSYTGHSHSRS